MGLNYLTLLIYFILFPANLSVYSQNTMKYWVSHLPLEVWVDVFRYPGKSRKELGEIADKLGRKFAEYLQFYLHEWGKRMLGTLLLDKEAIIPPTPIPENIRFFKNIRIRHFDSRILAFLRQISGLFNSAMNLDFDYFSSSNDLAKLHTILDHIAPLFHGINSLEFKQRAIPLVQQYFGPKLAQVKLISLNLNPDDNDPFDPATNQALNFFLNWLTSADERSPTEPKFLELYSCADIKQDLSMAVQQQFQSAEHPSIFVIKFFGYCKYDFQLDLKNNIGEQLHGQFDEDGDFWIFRHPAHSNRTQLEEWVKEMVEKCDTSSRIEFFAQLTIDTLDANAGHDELGDAVEEGADDQPSTSKKSKLT